MEKENAKTLQRRLAQLPSIKKTYLFYVDGGRVYTWEDTYDPAVTDRFGVEIHSMGTALQSEALHVLADTDIDLVNDLTELGRFRVSP